MPVKTVQYDTRSLYPRKGDTVEVVIQRINQKEPEILEAVYLGAFQFEAYTTPYFCFGLGDNRVRFVCGNDVREWAFEIAAPEMKQQASLPEPPF
jgi:hypothetical protein